MQSATLKNWQRSWGTLLALLAVMAWCMPVLAMSCAVSAMPSAASLLCSTMDAGVSSEQMPCCHKVPVPPAHSTDNHPAICCVDSNADLLAVAFPKPHAPLWALVIASPQLTYGDSNQTVFYPREFFYPPSSNAYSPAFGRAPPFLI